MLRKKWGTSGYQHARKRYVAALPSITTLRERIDQQVGVLRNCVIDLSFMEMRLALK